MRSNIISVADRVRTEVRAWRLMFRCVGKRIDMRGAIALLESSVFPIPTAITNGC